MAADEFTIWIAWQKGDKPRPWQPWHTFQEPAEATDIAEKIMRVRGTEGETYAELHFNGDEEPHTVMFYLRKEEGEAVFGIWNTETARWPIFYPPEMQHGGEMLAGVPEGFESENDSDDSEIDDDANTLDLGASDDESEGAEDESEEDASDDDEEDEWEDENDDSEDGSEADDSDEDSDEDVDASDDNDDEGDEDQDEDAEDGEDEAEMPRLKIFAKMKGPKGWRKRAENEELLERNVFALKVGVVDEDGQTPGQQEKNVRAHIEFVETDAMRTAGLLRVKLPEGVTLEDFKQLKSGWITVEVPYGDA